MTAAGICSIRQGLTPEAAASVKQAIALARRRGHSQVTPLHVASAMLASAGGLFRRACVQTHSHPLQCKALELCFNVALNRLPVSTYYPSLSNALVAAFKRAQAHQRRGENHHQQQQQQPILAVKIEAEQLVISILDDPSVSRVMREAGFSSPQVKNRVEKAVNHNHNNPTASRKNNSKNSATISAPPDFGRRHHQLVVPKLAPTDHYNVRNEDVTAVLDAMSGKSRRRRRNVVATGECVDTIYAVIRAVMDNIVRGAEIVPADLKSARLASIPLFSLTSLSRTEIDRKVLELSLMMSLSSSSSSGLVLYVGDLKWMADFWSDYYSSMEYIIMEMQRLIRDCKNLWVVGIASRQAYTKCCRAGHPSLEDLWELSSVPVGSSLGLSLNLDLQSPKGRENRPPMESTDGINLRGRFNGGEDPAKPSSSLPSWLQQCKEQAAAVISNNDGDRVFDFFDIFEPGDKRFPHSNNNLRGSSRNRSPGSSVNGCPETITFGPIDAKPDLLSNPNSSPNSASSSEVGDDRGGDDGNSSFKEVDGANALQEASLGVNRKRKRGDDESNGEDDDRDGLVLSLDLNITIDDGSECEEDDEQSSNGIVQLVDGRVVFRVHDDQDL